MTAQIGRANELIHISIFHTNDMHGRHCALELGSSDATLAIIKRPEIESDLYYVDILVC